MTQDRNTPRDIVFDMENDISTLRRHSNLLLCLSTDEGLEDVLQGALTQVASGLSDCHRDLHDKFKRLFEQVVRTDGDKPEPSQVGQSLTEALDYFAIECQLVKLNGLAQALSILSRSDEFQERQREALGGMAEAFDDQFNKLWRLIYDHDFRAGPAEPKAKEEPSTAD